MSLPPGTSSATSHRLLFQRSSNSVVYSRVGEIGACAVPPGVSGLAHASWVLALLPTVVNVDTGPIVSHGPKAAMLRSSPGGVVQPASAVQQPTTELVGVWSGESRAGLAVK